MPSLFWNLMESCKLILIRFSNKNQIAGTLLGINFIYVTFYLNATSFTYLYINVAEFLLKTDDSFLLSFYGFLIQIITTFNILCILMT